MICLVLTACGGNNGDRQLVISNPADIERTDELVVLKRSDIESKIGVVPTGKFVQVTGGNGLYWFNMTIWIRMANEKNSCSCIRLSQRKK